MADHLVSRPRLTSRLTSATVSIVWGGAGCGKSTLAAELRDELGVATVEVRLDAGDHRPDHVVGRMRRALRRAGRSDAVAAMAEEIGSPSAAFEALAEWLAGEPNPVHLVIDDAHNADEDAGALLARLADSLPPQHRVSFLVRGPAPDLAPISRLKAAIWLDASDLALTGEEVAALAQGRAGIALGSDEAEALRQATGGWVDAVVLAIGRLAEAEDRSRELGELTRQPSILAHMVSELFESLDERSRAAIVQMAHLPLLSVELARLASGGRIPDLLGRATGAGVPMSRIKDGWWEIAAGTREFIAGLDPLDAEVAEPAAEAYLRGGEIPSALQVLLRAGLAERAAALVAGLAPDRLASLEPSELGALIDVLPAEAIAEHPRVLIHFARACEPAAQLRERAEALERAQAIAGETQGPLRREIDVEVARDLVAGGRPGEAGELVSAVLERCSQGEIATQARGLEVLGQVAGHAGDEASLREAESLLDRSLVLCRALGQTGWAGQVTMNLVDRVYFARGQYDLALQRVDEVLRELPRRGSGRAIALTYRAAILIDRGDFAEAESTLTDARRLTDVSGDQRAAAFVSWDAARLASQRGDPALTVAALHEVEVHHAEWFEGSDGTEFLAEAADLLDRVGESEAASRYLRRARERNPDPTSGLGMAEAAILARSGDPATARGALAAVRALPRTQRRDRWRLTLLEAYAAHRAGDQDAAELAGRAFDEAAALGPPALPRFREQRVAQRLLPLAVSAGSVSAARLQSEIPPLEVSVFGDLELSRAGHVLSLPGGKPRELVELVAASGGAIAAEDAIELLWPETSPEAGRRAMRNALNRLRRNTGEVLVRDGGAVRLPESSWIDLLEFERAARDALAGQSDAAAIRRALAGYGGEVLASHHGSWAEAPRERARELRMNLLDQLAEAVEAEGQLNEALRLIEESIEIDPLTERRYLIAARILAAQGRHGTASQTLARGRSAIREAGLPVPASFAKLEEAIGVGSEHLQAP